MTCFCSIFMTLDYNRSSPFWSLKVCLWNCNDIFLKLSVSLLSRSLLKTHFNVNETQMTQINKDYKKSPVVV